MITIKPLTVYKSAGDYIITLEIPVGTHTNLDREDVVDADYAQFRCQRAQVLSITHKFDKSSVDKIVSDYDKSYIYIVGEFVEIPLYDMNNNDICTKGIHFYNSQEVAFYHNNGTIPEKGEYINKGWCSNGNLEYEIPYIDGKIHGIFKEWHSNGNLMYEIPYINGKEHGIWKHWYDNGILRNEKSYVDGKLHGILKGWYKNGNLECEHSFINGDEHGIFKDWYENGNLKYEKSYINGKKHGIWKIWYSNGNLQCELSYVDDIYDGVYVCGPT
jgi:antitoxin component YwqK of YwqJK toxin-antitoxin module